MGVLCFPIYECQMRASRLYTQICASIILNAVYFYKRSAGDFFCANEWSARGVSIYIRLPVKSWERLHLFDKTARQYQRERTESANKQRVRLHSQIAHVYFRNKYTLWIKNSIQIRTINYSSFDGSFN